MFLPPKVQKASINSDNSSNYALFSKKYMKYSSKNKKSTKSNKVDIDHELKFDQNLLPNSLENTTSNHSQKAEILKWY